MTERFDDDETIDMEAVFAAMREMQNPLVRKDTVEEGSPEFGAKVLGLMAEAKYEMRSLLGHVPTSIEERVYLASVTRDIVRQRWVHGDTDMVLSPPTEVLIRYFSDAYGADYEMLIRWMHMEQEDEVSRILQSGSDTERRLIRNNTVTGKPTLDSDYPLPIREYLRREQEKMHKP